MYNLGPSKFFNYLNTNLVYELVLFENK